MPGQGDKASDGSECFDAGLAGMGHEVASRGRRIWREGEAGHASAGRRRDVTRWFVQEAPADVEVEILPERPLLFKGILVGIPVSLLLWGGIFLVVRWAL